MYSQEPYQATMQFSVTLMVLCFVAYAANFLQQLVSCIVVWPKCPFIHDDFYLRDQSISLATSLQEVHA